MLGFSGVGVVVSNGGQTGFLRVAVLQVTSGRALVGSIRPITQVSMPNVLSELLIRPFFADDGKEIGFETAADVISPFVLSPSEMDIGQTGLLYMEEHEWALATADVPVSKNDDVWFTPDGFIEAVPFDGGRLVVPSSEFDETFAVWAFELTYLGDGTPVLDFRRAKINLSGSARDVVKSIKSVLSDFAEASQALKRKSCPYTKDRFLCAPKNCPGECLSYKKSDKNRERKLCTCV